MEDGQDLGWYRCPLTGKHAYTSRKIARAARRATRRSRSQGALGIYRCMAPGGCGDLHLGHLAAGDTRAKLAARKAADLDRDARMAERGQL